MTPDYDRAAIKATETLIRYQINATPVDPARILKNIPGVMVFTFAEVASMLGEDRRDIVNSFGENQDAVTSIKTVGGRPHYAVAFNQRLPFYMVQRALSRELGHILLGHNGTRPPEIRMAEAYCFAHHLLCPRPLIRALQEEGVPITVEIIGALTGCYERCLSRIRKEPGARVPKELNRELRVQFAEYVKNFLDFQKYLSSDDPSALVDFGTYMENYTE